AVEHVLEVHVAAHVQLHGAVNADAALLEETGQHTVGDGGTDLGLDVITDDGQTGVGELLCPLRIGGDEDGQGVDEPTARIQGRLGVELVRLLGTDREVGDQDVHAGILECLDDVDRLGGGFLDGGTV